MMSVNTTEQLLETIIKFVTLTMDGGKSYKLLAAEHQCFKIQLLYTCFICFANTISTEAIDCHFPKTGKSI